jgi:hypothetical protein
MTRNSDPGEVLIVVAEAIGDGILYGTKTGLCALGAIALAKGAVVVVPTGVVIGAGCIGLTRAGMHVRRLMKEPKNTCDASVGVKTYRWICGRLEQTLKRRSTP